MDFIFYLSLALFTALFGALYNDLDYDFWARLIVGKSYFQTGMLFNNDFYSYGTTHEFIDHEWGSSLIFYLIQENFNDVGLFLFKTIITFLTFFIITKIIRLEKKDVKFHFLFFFFAVQSVAINIFQIVRCQIFTFFFFTLFLYILKYVKQTKNYRILWCLPILNIVWANLHGGFVMGLALIGIFIIGEFLNKNKKYSKYLALTFLLTSLSTLINPYGYKYILFIFDAFALNRIHISEWQSAFFNKNFMFFMLKFKAFFIVTMTIFAYSLIKNIKKLGIANFYKKIDKTKYIILIFVSLISLKALRCHVFFTYCVMALCYVDFYNIFNKKLPQNIDKIKEIILLILVIITTATRMYFYKFINTTPNNKFPAYIVEFLKQNNIKGNIFTNFHIGSYLAYKLYPNNFVFMDGRYEEVYDVNLIDEMQSFLYMQDKQEFLNKYHTDILIIEKVYPIRLELDKSKDWSLFIEDDMFLLYLSKDYQNKKFTFPKKDINKSNKTKFETHVDWEK